MMTLMFMHNLNARIGKIALIAVAAAIIVFAALGAPSVMEAAGGGQAVANGSCDNGYWPVIFGGLFGWLMDLIFNLCGR